MSAERLSELRRHLAVIESNIERIESYRRDYPRAIAILEDSRRWLRHQIALSERVVSADNL